MENSAANDTKIPIDFLSRSILITFFPGIFHMFVHVLNAKMSKFESIANYLYRWFSFSFSCECNTNLWNCNVNSHWNADTQNPLKMYSSIFPFNETSDLHQNSLLLNIYRNKMSLVIPLQIHFIYHFVNQLAQMETHNIDLKKRDHRLFALFSHFIWKCASSISSNEDLIFFFSYAKVKNLIND